MPRGDQLTRQWRLVQFLAGRLDFKPQVGSLRVGAPDAELLDLEPALVFHDLVEDLLHDVGVDQMSFRFHHFVERQDSTAGTHDVILTV